VSGRGWDHDLPFGEEGERKVGHLLNLPQLVVEVKREREQKARVFVELAQDPSNRGRWKPSGLSVTESAYWVFVRTGDFGDLFIFVTPESLREQIRRMESWGMEPAVGGRDGTNPTKGYWVALSKLFSPWGYGA
jgi:hypothetical protein